MAETQANARRGSTQSHIGLVLSDKMMKTVVVEITQMTRHPVYEKYVRRQVRYKAHDENNECKVGDRVEIIETRPLSKTKRWKVKRVIERAKL